MWKNNNKKNLYFPSIRNKRYGSIALLTFCSNLLTAQPKVYCETYSKFNR